MIATIDLFIDAVGGMEVYKLSPIVLKAVTEAAEKRPGVSVGDKNKLRSMTLVEFRALCGDENLGAHLLQHCGQGEL